MDDGNRNAAMAYYKGGGADGAPGKSKVKADIANDDFRKRAMAAYSAKGKTATMEAASTLKTSSVSTKQSLGMGRGGRGGGNHSDDDSRGSLESESDLSDSQSGTDGYSSGGPAERRSGGGGSSPKASSRHRGRKSRRRRRHSSDESLTESDSETDSPKRKPRGFEDNTFGTEAAKLAKKKRVRGAFWKALDKCCPCCSVRTSAKYGADRADAKFKMYEGVDNTLEPILRLLSLFTLGVPSTESSIPMAHLLPLILSSLLCLGGSLLFASDWREQYPLNSASFVAIFGLCFVFLSQGTRYFGQRGMSKLCQELEGRSWHWTRQLPALVRLVNRTSALFLGIITLGYGATVLSYFVVSDLQPVGGAVVFYVSRILFGFYIHGVVFCMPVLFYLESAMVVARVKEYTVNIGKFPNLETAIEEHIEIWKCVERLSQFWTSTIGASFFFSLMCCSMNVHYLLARHSHYFLQNMLLPSLATFIFLYSAAGVTRACQQTAIHLSGYRSSADIFLAPMERIDFLTYLQANDPGFRIAGILVTPRGVNTMGCGFLFLVAYLFTLQLSTDLAAEPV